MTTPAPPPLRGRTSLSEAYIEDSDTEDEILMPSSQPLRPDREKIRLPDRINTEDEDWNPFNVFEVTTVTKKSRRTAADRDAFMKAIKQGLPLPTQPDAKTIPPERLADGEDNYICDSATAGGNLPELNLYPTPASSQPPPAPELDEPPAWQAKFSQAEGEKECWSLPSTPAPPTPKTPRRRKTSKKPNQPDTGGTLSFTSSPITPQVFLNHTTCWSLASPEKELSGPQSQSRSQRKPPTKRKVKEEFTEHGAPKYARQSRGSRSKKVLRQQDMETAGDVAGVAGGGAKKRVEKVYGVEKPTAGEISERACAE